MLKLAELSNEPDVLWDKYFLFNSPDYADSVELDLIRNSYWRIVNHGGSKVKSNVDNIKLIKIINTYTKSNKLLARLKLIESIYKELGLIIPASLTSKEDIVRELDIE